MLDAATIGRTRFDIDAPGLIDKRVTQFEFVEKLNRPWSCEITFAEKTHSLDLSAMIDEPATLIIRNTHGGVDTDKGLRTVKGLVSEIEQGVTGYWWTEYKMVISPPIARLEHRADSRIFQNMTVQAIIEAVLDDAGVTERKIALREAGQTVREYCVQYRETDLDFITRLCAEEGILYSHDVENSAMLLMWDSGLARPSLGEMEYNCRPGSWNPDLTTFIQQFTYRERVRPGTFSNQDYYFKNPRFRWPGTHGTDHKGMITGGGKEGPLKVYDYSLRNKSNAGDASAKISQRRLEELRKDAAVGHGISSIPKLTSGTRFELTDHENDQLNRKYLLVELRHTGRQDQSIDHEPVGNESGDDSRTEYQNQFLSVPDDVQWRDKFWVLGDQPLKPRVDGPQMATVVGPAGEEIYCDEYGRVKLQFPWDRYGKSDENSSCWVRVSQLWAGAKYGGMAIPRIGHEVIVEHLDGDIDQPIITGRTYHETQKVPYDLPANKTRTVWKSDTHKGDGYNELRFEDEAGREEIWIHAQKDENHKVENNRHKEVNHIQTEIVGIAKNIAVGVTHNEVVGVNYTQVVGAPMAAAGMVLGSLGNASTAMGNAIAGLQDSNVVGKPSTETPKDLLPPEPLATSEIMDKAGLGALNELASGNKTVQVSSNQQEIVGQMSSEDVGAAKVFSVGRIMVSDVGEHFVVKAGKTIEFQCGGSKILMKDTGEIVIMGREMHFEADNQVQIKAKIIDLN